MGVRSKGTIALTKATPVVLFEELTAANFPGIYGGKIDLTQLGNVADEINLKLEVKYDTASAYRNAETATFKQADKIYRITPVEEAFGYKLTIELLAASPSATASLEFVITRNAI